MPKYGPGLANGETGHMFWHPHDGYFIVFGQSHKITHAFPYELRPEGVRIKGLQSFLTVRIYVALGSASAFVNAPLRAQVYRMNFCFQDNWCYS